MHIKEEKIGTKKTKFKQFQDAVKMQNFKVHLRCICTFSLPSKPLDKRGVEDVQDAVHFKMHIHFEPPLYPFVYKAYKVFSKCSFFPIYKYIASS